MSAPKSRVPALLSHRLSSPSASCEIHPIGKFQTLEHRLLQETPDRCPSFYQSGQASSRISGWRFFVGSSRRRGRFRARTDTARSTRFILGARLRREPLHGLFVLSAQKGSFHPMIYDFPWKELVGAPLPHHPKIRVEDRRLRSLAPVHALHHGLFQKIAHPPIPPGQEALERRPIWADRNARGHWRLFPKPAGATSPWT